jgi:hypothetical protein
MRNSTTGRVLIHKLLRRTDLCGKYLGDIIKYRLGKRAEHKQTPRVVPVGGICSDSIYQLISLI